MAVKRLSGVLGGAPAGSPASSVVIAPVYTITDYLDSTTYTYTNCTLGADAADRVIIIAFIGKRSSGTYNMTGMTLDGNATTEVLTKIQDANFTICLHQIAYSSGTNKTLVVSAPGFGSGHAIVLFRMTGQFSNTAYSTLSAGPSNEPSGTLNIPSGGAMVAVGGSTVSTNAITWTGATEYTDEAQPVVGYFRYSHTYDTAMTEETGRTVSLSSASTVEGFQAAAWY
jgi:hypothetical protein